MGTNRVIDDLFMTIRMKAQRALAYSNDEKTRMELLALLESTALFEIKVHQAMMENSKPVDKVLLAPNTEMTSEIMAELGPVTEFIELKGEEE